jgi:hypothetical protein
MDTPPTLIHNGLTLLAAPRTTLSSLLPVLIARLALNGGLRVLDGGNRFNAYQTSRELRRQTENLTQVLERIQIARAFTCYQMTALLFETGSMKTPTLVLDLLVTFDDESVRLEERQRLLRSAVRQLKHLRGDGLPRDHRAGDGTAAEPIAAGAARGRDPLAI